ncbi:hypothetical protein [Paludibacterium paludis]|uniref:Uncharacterized protein n=1 Tax=Paludibacterium paludis TaxID=1225769 RepID=A0A918P4Z2_9NEIS|nr:hypothetical protein [Paludibacterium paludis]GGY23384.1 hypothetical protein GCM10011289_28980 [Paludibacterium paludis]
MTLDAHNFTLYDVREFPIVTANNDALVPGFAARWERELDALVNQPRPFALIFPEGRPEQESREDRQRRMDWFKANKAKLASVCLALISIEPDARKQESLRKRALTLAPFFGVPLDTASTPQDARTKAEARLAGRC